MLSTLPIPFPPQHPSYFAVLQGGLSALEVVGHLTRSSPPARSPCLHGRKVWCCPATRGKEAIESCRVISGNCPAGAATTNHC